MEETEKICRTCQTSRITLENGARYLEENENDACKNCIDWVEELI